MTFHRKGISGTPLPNACRKGKCLAAAVKLWPVRRPGPWPCEHFQAERSGMRPTQQQMCQFYAMGGLCRCEVAQSQ